MGVNISQAIKEKEETLKMLRELCESDEVIELITKYNYCPVQPLKKRYEILKKVRTNSEQLEYFNKILQFLGGKYAYRVLDDPDMEFACEYWGNYSYDFELISSLAEFYSQSPQLYEGHLDCISKIFNKTTKWNEIKTFWLKLIK